MNDFPVCVNQNAEMVLANAEMFPTIPSCHYMLLM